MMLLLLIPQTTLLKTHTASSSSYSYVTTRGTNIKGEVERRAKIRAVCLSIFCVHSLIRLFFCLAKAALPLSLPYACFSFLLQLYSTSNGMAYSIRYAPS